VLVLLLALPAYAQEVAQEERESAKYYRKWLNQDVIYTITAEEREVFNGLTTDDEKDQFIEQFWFRRDPDPNTAINEFREEHYRRIAFVNDTFGSGIPGWKTDRGRIYIMFGDPVQKEYHAGGGMEVRAPYEGGGRTSTYPYEIWRYHHIEGVGDDIEIEFVDRSWSGEFKIAVYPWEKDMLLNVDGLGETSAERLGMAKRYQRPGLHPGNMNNTYYMTRFLGNRFRDRPFERLQRYYSMQKPPPIKQKELQQVVETRIGYDNLPFNAEAYHLWIDHESALVPVTIEVPNKFLNYVEDGGNYKARVGIYGRVTSMGGRVITEFEQTLLSRFPKAYLEHARTESSLFQRTVSIPSGRHKVDIVVKDLGSGDIGTKVLPLSLTAPEMGAFQASPVVLAEMLEPLESFPERPTTFVIGDVRVVPKVGKAFGSSEEMGVYLQIYNPALDSSSMEPAVSIEYTLLRNREVVDQFVDDQGGTVHFFSPQRLVLVRKMPLAELEKGRYRLMVKVDDTISGQSVSSQADFEISGGG
jgi:GWxTD domain-containing protein